MEWRKQIKRLLFPPAAVLLLLLPVSVGGMLYAMRRLGESHPVTIAAYVLSFYTLTVWCVRVPAFIRRFRSFQEENRYIKRWRSDVRLRINVTLSGNALWNGAYAALQFGLGLYHKSAWFYALAGYYASLGLMRFFIVRHTLRYRPGDRIRQELIRYRSCGWVFLLMNLALSAMMFMMIWQNRMVRHHEITTITMAAYTFTTLTMAIVNVIRYRNYNSPAISAAKAISLAAACVSMLTLENTMLATFGGDDLPPQTYRLLLALSGGVISMIIVVMAVYMIATASRTLKRMEN